VFDEVFDPIVKALHPKFNSQLEFKNDFELGGLKSWSDHIQRETSRIPLLRLTAKRNFSNYPFAPMLSTEAKIQIEKKIQETLGELYGQYHQLSKLDGKIKDWL